VASPPGGLQVRDISAAVAAPAAAASSAAASTQNLSLGSFFSDPSTKLYDTGEETEEPHERIKTVVRCRPPNHSDMEMANRNIVQMDKKTGACTLISNGG
jgi:hypothetical protein